MVIKLITLELENLREILIERYGRDCLNEAILNGKKKDLLEELYDLPKNIILPS